MKNYQGVSPAVRWVLSVILVAAGMSATWAWGRVARLAEPSPQEPVPAATALYAAWQPAGRDQPLLFRSLNGGVSWQPLQLDRDAAPIAWADDGGQRLAVALDDGSVLRSADQGSTWSVLPEKVRALSLAWDDAGVLYLGTDGQGVYRLSTADALAPLAAAQPTLVRATVQHLVVAGGRLFATTPDGLFYTDDAGGSWASEPAPGRISALVALDPNTLLIGAGAQGILRSTDAGQSWAAASAGLGAAAGLYPEITALRSDPQEPGVLYAAVGYLVGGTELHFSAAGVFVSMDGGDSWVRLAGPSFPEARRAADLVVLPGKPLYAQSVAAAGLQSYEPDVVGALAVLEQSQDAPRVERANAVRVLGLARHQAAEKTLLAALSDQDPAVSLLAAEALGRIGDPAAVSSLLVALEHPSTLVRLNAARALGILRAEAAVEPLGMLLMTGDAASVSVAANALSQIGSPAAAEALLATLSDPELTARRHAALSALEAMGEPAVEPLAGTLAGADVIARRNAAEALGWIGAKSAAPSLVRALRDGSADVRGQVAWALGEIGDPAARRALARAERRDPDEMVRSAAGLALSRLTAETTATAGWPASWAATLNQLQPVRWLILAFSLAAAAWLVVGQRELVPVLARLRAGRH